MGLPLHGLLGFDWDKGNSGKNEKGHGVADKECEEAFWCKPRWIGPSAHPAQERRYLALAKTLAGRLLAVVFTVRNRHIRVISARPMSRKERRTYEKKAI